MDDINISHDPLNGPKKQTLKGSKQTVSEKQWNSIMNNIDGLTRATNQKTKSINEMDFISGSDEKRAVSIENKDNIPPETENQNEIPNKQKNKPQQKKCDFDLNALIAKKINSKRPKSTPAENLFTGNTSVTSAAQEVTVKESIPEYTKINLKDVEMSSKNTYFINGELKTREFKVKDLQWSRNNEEWNKKFNLVDPSVSSIEVKNKNDKTTARYANGHFYVKEKRVTEEKFQKYVQSKGAVMTVTYKPDIEPVNIKQTIKMHQFEMPDKINLCHLPKPIAPSEILANNGKQITRKIDTQVYHKIKSIADRLNCDHNDLMAVINAESGFNPKARNRHSGATGLIQFMPKTAKGLGTSIDELKNMTALEQLDYVEQYLQSVKKSIFKNDEQLSGGDLYALIFLPKNAKKDELAYKGHAYYDLNKVLDVDGDGIISKADLDRVVKSKYINVKTV